MEDPAGTPWPVVARQHARMVKPFPLRRLSDALYHVQQDAGSVNESLTRLLIDPPSLPEAWQFELDALSGLLESLRARCDDALPVLEEMARTADADFRRATEALVAVIRGIGEESTPTDQAA